MTKTVHVIGNDTATTKMFAEAGWNCWDDKPDLICFTGGSDVSPDLYCQANVHCYGVNEHRDIREVGQYMKYLRMGVPMVGICRGAQFLNVMQGGSMIQHIDGHGMPRDRRSMRSIHRYDLKGRQYRVDKGNKPLAIPLHEDHHQAMVPTAEGLILGMDSRDGNPEIVLYEPNGYGSPSILCFQAHPEWGHEGTHTLFFQMIEEYL